ncbi:MAG: HPr family phosphocarrier protein [bacterium]
MTEELISWDVQDTVEITHAVGLHARPSVKFTKCAKQFQARIEIASEAAGPWIDAKSIVKVMGAKMPQGTLLQLRAQGADAQEAVRSLVDLVNSDFEEAKDVSSTAV